MLNWLDLTITGIILFSVILSLLRGFIKEALSVACWIGAFLIAIYGHKWFESFLDQWIHDEQILTIISSVVLFIISLIVLSIITYFISELLTQNMISGVDRLLGLLFGVIRGALIVVALLFLIEVIFPQIMDQDAWKNSVLVPYFIVFTHYFSDLFELTKSKVDQLDLSTLKI